MRGYKREETSDIYPLPLFLSSSSKYLSEKMPYSLKGRNVLVTAGSRYDSMILLPRCKKKLHANHRDRGLGAIICKKFAEEGANVAINYVSNSAAAEELADTLTKEYSTKIFIVQGVSGSGLNALCTTQVCG